MFYIGDGAAAEIAGLTITGGNTASYEAEEDGNGGGIHNSDAATLTVKDSIISGNRSIGTGCSSCGNGAGINNDGTLSVTNSTISGNESDNWAGGIGNYGTAATLSVTNSTISGNRAYYDGGGIDNKGGLKSVTNSTISGNYAGYRGGGIYNNPLSPQDTGPLTLTSTTVAGNSVGDGWDMRTGGGGIRNGAGEIKLSNTIIANNPTGGNCFTYSPDATTTDLGYNISSDDTCPFQGLSRSDTDPQLDPQGLQNNGGPTKTIALLPTSPAVNAIPSEANGCGTDVKSDQRGVTRPQFGFCDIGSYERNKKR